MSESDPTVQILAPRPRGRPRAIGGEGGLSISAWVSNEDADRIYAMAKRYNCSISEVIRRVMRARSRAVLGQD